MRHITIILFAVSAVFYAAGPSTAAQTSRCQPTMNDVEGPYYLPGAPFRNQLAGLDEQGERVVIKGTIVHADCQTPIGDALIEVWQTDGGGKYYYRAEGFRLRGQMKTDDKGYYQFSTVKPGRYRILNGFRPAHIHMKISHPDFETIITQLYFKGDPYLWPKDACGRGCKSNDPQRIIGLHDDSGALSGTFNIILKPLEH
jgi:protocatechuate 3,4-dioxygenase beta subunit